MTVRRTTRFARQALFVLALAALLGACAAEIAYTPNAAEVSRRMSVDDARKTIKDIVLRGETDGKPMGVVANDDKLDVSGHMRGIRFSATRITFDVLDDDGHERSFGMEAKDIEGNVIGYSDGPEVNLRSHELGGDSGYWLYADSVGEKDIERLADALAVLKYAAAHGGTPDDQARFETAARAYRAAAVKPLPGEDVRRYKVQAEAAVREKRFEDAADLYDKALAIAPWWPEGRFNRALVLAEIGEYSAALTEMQRYLALVPDAPNARMAQDKIYEWEAKAPASSPAATGRHDDNGGSPSDSGLGLGGGLSK